MTHEYPPLHLCVVGHTNVGKTSLLRTLLKDDSFGKVANESATTRHVAKSNILDSNNTLLIELYDTPGMEDTTGVMDHLTEITNERTEGIDRLTAFLTAVKSEHADGDTPNNLNILPKPRDDFSQEAKVITATLFADLIPYVIDSRFAPIAKYKDEVALLSYAATPILPICNFVAHSQYINDSQTVPKQRNLHIWVLFDTVSFDFDREIRLWQNSATLLNNPAALGHLITDLAQKWHILKQQANQKIADFLVSVASYTQKIIEGNDPMLIQLSMQAAVKQAEETVIDELLALYQFYHTQTSIKPIMATLSNCNSFSFSHRGTRTVGASTIGAVIGAGFDVITLGTTLGAGTVLGGLLGGGIANADALKDKAQKQKRLIISDTSLLFLIKRLTALHATLRHTGHAVQNAISIDDTSDSLVLPKALRKAREYPKYSHLPFYPKNLAINRPSRQKLTAQLISQLPDIIPLDNIP